MQFKNLIFDFDGVLVESNDIRIEGFRRLFQDYPENEVSQLMSYVEKNGGISRYVKIRYFFEVIRRESLEIEDLQSWANRYSKLVKEKIIQAESVIGSDFFQIMEKVFNLQLYQVQIRKNYGKYANYVI